MKFTLVRDHWFILVIVLAICAIMTLSCTACREAAAEKRPQWEYTIPGETRLMEFSEDGESFATVTGDDMIHFYLTGRGGAQDVTPRWSSGPHPNITGLSISGDGRYLLAGMEHGTGKSGGNGTGNVTILQFNAVNGSVLWTVSVPGTLTGLRLTWNGSVAVVVTDHDLFVLTPANTTNPGVTGPAWNASLPHRITSFSLATAPTSEEGGIVLATLSGHVYRFNASSNKPLWNTSLGSEVRAVAISGDGATMIVGSVDGRIHALRGTNGTALWNHTAGGNITSVDVSWSGARLAAGTGNGTILLFHLDDPDPAWTYGAGGSVSSVDLSADGTVLSSGSADGHVYHFRTTGPDPDPVWVREYPGRTPVVQASSDGSYIAVAPGSETVHIFARVTAFINFVDPTIALRYTEIEFRCQGESDDGSVIRYVLDSSVSGEIYNGTGATANIPMSVGYHDVSLRVLDQHGRWSGWTTTRVIISDRPQASIENISFVYRDDIYKVRIEANTSLEIGTIVQYIWSSNRDGHFFTGEDAIIEYDGLSVDEHIISLRVISSYGFESETTQRSFIVHPRPVVSIYSIQPNPAVAGEAVAFRGIVTDGGNPVRFTWHSSIDGEFHNGTEPSADNSSLSIGNHTISFRVLDHRGLWSRHDTSHLLVTSRPEAVIASITPGMVFSGSAVTFRAQVSDGRPLQRVVWHSSHTGELYNGTDLSFTTSGLSAGSHDIGLVVEDEDGIWSARTTATFHVMSPPVIRVAYSGGNVVELTVIVDIPVSLTLTMNGAPGGRNESFAYLHVLSVSISEGMNNFILSFTTDDGASLSTDPQPLELKKGILHESLSGTSSIDGGEYLALPIADLDQKGAVNGPLAVDTVLEITIEASGPIDIFFARDRDLDRWKDIQRERTAVFTYYSEFSGLNVTTFSVVLPTRDEVVYYLILDNTPVPASGADPSGGVDVTYTVMLIESPEGTPQSSYEIETIRMTFDDIGPTEEDGGTVRIIVIVLLVVILAIVGVLVAGMVGVVDLSGLPVPLPDLFLGGLAGSSDSDWGSDNESDTGWDDEDGWGAGDETGDETGDEAGDEAGEDTVDGSDTSDDGEDDGQTGDDDGNGPNNARGDEEETEDVAAW